MNEILIVIVEILAYSFFAFAEAEIEGKYGGGGKNPRFFKFGPIKLRRYHLFTIYLAIPTFILLSLLTAGFSWRLFGLLVGGGLIGGIFQDFVWFVVNPNYGIKKFTRKDAYWLRWIRIGKIELPYFYITNVIEAAIIWYVFLVVI